MKRTIIIIVCFSIFSTYCSKDKGAFTSPIEMTPTDSIYYIDISDTSIYSVYGWNTSSNPSGCIPIPRDTIIKYELDIDGNFTNDFIFFVETKYQLASMSYPCSNYIYGISAKPINSYDSIAVLVCNRWICDSLKLGESIDENRFFSNYLQEIKWTAPTTCGYFTNNERYLGVKLRRESKTLFGWICFQTDPSNINKVTIKSFAVNKTNGHAISAGQTQ